MSSGCDYFDAGVCRSCTLLPTAYDAQLAGKVERVRSMVDAATWLPPYGSRQWGFRNKAKLVVSGTISQPTLGILDEHRRGVDLQGCPLHEPGIRAALPHLAEFVTRAELAPYDIDARAGELKHLLVTESPDGELMVRWVLRSREAETRIRKHLPALLAQLPIVVASLNIQPEHKAIIEGEREIALHGDSLAMRVNDLTLHLRPNSFFQTNTEVAAALYREAVDWSQGAGDVVDLYCGVGGFALHLAASGRAVTGIEVSAEAIESARMSATEAHRDARFEVGDATAWTGEADLLVVNPPRRGLGPDLTATIERARPRQLLYSSCNARSLAQDLAALPSYRVTRAKVFDMFPNTDHGEVLVAATTEPP